MLAFSDPHCVPASPPPLPVPQVLYSDSFRKQVQGKAAFVLDTPEMRRVRETQRIISGVRFWLPLLKCSVFTSVRPGAALQISENRGLIHTYSLYELCFTLIIYIILCRQHFLMIPWRFIDCVYMVVSRLLSRCDIMRTLRRTRAASRPPPPTW